MAITDLYDVGITILGFGCRKVSLGCRKVSLGCRKVSLGSQKGSFGSHKSIENHLWVNFGAQEATKSDFIKRRHLFWVILEVILGAKSESESHKFEV